MSEVAPANEAITEVLGEFDGVELASTRDDTIEVYVQGRRIVFPHDPSHSTWRAALRDQLRAHGAHPRTALDSKNDVTPEPEVIPNPPQPAYQTGSYTVFQSGRVIAIRLDRDLMIAKGNVLVIPLHRPNTFIDMPNEQFDILFDKTAETINELRSAPPPQAIEPPWPEEPEASQTKSRFEPFQPDIEAINDILLYLQDHPDPAKTKVIAEALNRNPKSVEGHLRRLMHRGVVIAPHPGSWTLPSAPPPMAPPPPMAAPPPPMAAPPPPMAAPESAAEPPSTQDTTTIFSRSRLGVSPQVGRILAAMAYVTKTSGKADLTTSQVTPYLDERDAKQYSARLHGMALSEFVQRGLPLPNARGWHYKITAKGLNIIKELGPWPYEVEDQPVPEWVTHL